MFQTFQLSLIIILVPANTISIKIYQNHHIIKFMVLHKVINIKKRSEDTINFHIINTIRNKLDMILII